MSEFKLRFENKIDRSWRSLMMGRKSHLAIELNCLYIGTYIVQTRILWLFASRLLGFRDMCILVPTTVLNTW